jgi:hypothetical protein
MSVEMSNFQNFNNFPENTIEENRYAKKLKGKSCTWSICWEFCIQKQCLYMQSSKKVNCVQNVFVQIVDVYATLKDPVFWPICKMRTATSICRILCISSTWITNLPTMDWWVLDHSCLIQIKRLLSHHWTSLELQLHLKGSDQWEGRGFGRSPNHYMLVGELVLDVFLSF